MKKFLTLILVSSFFSSTSKIAFIDSNNSINQNSEATYTVNFYNDEFTLLSSKKYAFGETPIPPSTPSKENPLPEYNYTFNGWAPSISIVTDDIDYVATYKTDVKTGEVIWVDGDGETLATDTCTYGTVPHYQGVIPTKTPTTTKRFVFKGWGTVSPVLAEKTTYVAQFDPIDIPPASKYSIRIACENCLVNKKKEIIEEYDPNTPLSYQFSNTSAATYHYPYSLNVKVDGEVSNNYTYDNLTGKLDITLTGNTEIEAIADNSCVLMKYKYSSSYPTVEIKCDGDFERVDWGDGTIIDVTNKMHTYSYSSKVNQYDIRIYGKLTNIGTTSKAITSVNISHSVTSVENEAFRNCSSLVSVSIPTSVTSIGESAFENCSSLEYINIPDSVTSIDVSAFLNCSSLESINIPDSVTYIGDYSFLGCTSLSSINIPDSVTSIHSFTFENCSSLESINIPDSVTSIGYRAFYNCSKLKIIDLSDVDHLITGNTAMFGGSTPIDRVIKIKNDLLYDYQHALYWSDYDDNMIGV